MHVAHVYKDVFPPVAGGIEKHIDGIRRTLTDVRTDVIVCSRSRRTEEVRVGTGVELRVGEFGRALSVPIAPSFPVHVWRSGADLLHVHMPNPLAEASALALPGDRPFVVSYHADIVRQAWLMPAYRHLIDACFDRARAVIAGTRGIVRNSPALQRVEDRVRHLPYAVDTDYFDPGRIPREAADALRATFRPPIILAVGRLVYYKGFEHLIAAARELPGTVLIAGSGPLEGQLRATAAPLPHVQVLGGVGDDELLTLLAAADCFVLPSTSRAESFGIATLEAQAMGVPAVVTDVGTGTTEALVPGSTGVVVEPGSPAALVAGVRAVLDGDGGVDMAQAARRHVLDHHSLPAQAQRLRAIYDEAVPG